MISGTFAKLARKIIPAQFRPTGYLENLVRTRTNGRIRCGPFAGMRWALEGRAPSRPGTTHRSSFQSANIHIPKLLGIYERELNPYIEQACALNFPLIVNVGAAEGYYAIGMALRNPTAKVIAFEKEATERSALAEAARLNAVSDRVEIREKCEPEDLEWATADTLRAFVICDAEGYEAVLLDPVSVPSLRRASILVELHEFIERGISEKIRGRFLATHHISQIGQQERTIADFPFKNFYTLCLPKSYLRWTVSESRPERMTWFWMEPRTAAEDSRVYT
jgi:hypothetical protein